MCYLNPNNNHPHVSVICTTYRTPAPLLEAAIGSIITQKHVSVELVLVIDDDNANESLPDSLRQFLAGDERVRIMHPGRVGRGAALNVGIKAARAEYIAIQDADDISHPLRLAAQMQILEGEPTLFALFSETTRINADTISPDWAKCCTTSTTVKQIGNRLMWKNTLCHTSMVCRRRMLLQLGGYSEQLSGQLDYDLYVRALRARKVLGKMPAALVAKRKHNGQFFTAARGLRQIYSSYQLQKNFLTRRFTCALLGPWVWAHLQFVLRASRYVIRRAINKCGSASRRR